jgi:hypothetical protein
MTRPLLEERVEARGAIDIGRRARVPAALAGSKHDGRIDAPAGLA